MINSKKTLCILAAGMGSRYGGLKQLDPVGPNGETILDYSIFDAIRAGFNKVVFVIREFFAEEFKEKIVSRYDQKMEVHLVFQELHNLPSPFTVPSGREKPWGTGHALLMASSCIHEPFVVINADDFYGFSAFQVASVHLEDMNSSTVEIAMVGYALKNTLSENGAVSRGICEVQKGLLTGICETHGILRKGQQVVHSNSEQTVSENALVSMNFWLYNTHVFNVAKSLFSTFLKEHGQELKSEFYIPSIAAYAITQSINIPVMRCNSNWAGVTYREDRELVERTIKSLHDKSVYPPSLEKADFNPHIPMVVEQLQVIGDFMYAVPYGSGHINQTYALTMNQGGHELRYILQRINKNVFKRPDLLMENISRVLEHVQNKLKNQPQTEASRKAMTLIKNKNGWPYVVDSDGETWRCYIFVEGALGHDVIKEPAQAYEAAKAFGKFQSYLSDMPGAPLHETIANFHHTPTRYQNFIDSVTKNPLGRVKDVEREIEFFCSKKDMASVLLNLVSEGKIPMRVTHNDTKLNNVLLDNESQEGVCVIDLDTVMPGLALYDFGDLVRTSTSPTAEDEIRTELVTCQPSMFEALVKGYLSTAKKFLTATEVDHLVFSGKLITYEIGLRFLTDYLLGDVYFKIKRPQHNLDRCRTQIALVKSIESQEARFKAMVLEAMK